MVGGEKYTLIRAMFRAIDKLKPIEGYLTVLVISKTSLNLS